MTDHASDNDPRPLAERMRPRTLDEFVGQSHLLGEGSLLRRAIAEDRLFSIIFWGGPGSGKTTLARILAGETRSHFVSFSAVLSGVKEIRAVVEGADRRQREARLKTVLFVDEIHRFNKAQQGAFLPYVERGDIILFGSTTENPSFEIIAPLLSRTKVLLLNALTREAMSLILDDALADEAHGLGGRNLRIEEDARGVLIEQSNGDARRALNTLDLAASLTSEPSIGLETIREALQKRTAVYDKAGEEHFNLISALHKSLRNSDVQAALYWLARMLAGGEDPLYIARRLVRFASEDVGLADPQALAVTLRAKEAYDFLGSPEGELALAEAVVYLGAAPKSNRVYAALQRVQKDVEEHPHEAAPLSIRNAVTDLMKEVGYGRDYRYAHDEALGTSAMETMPERLRETVFYEPGGMGFEKDIRKRMDWWREAKDRIRRGGG